ncbi:MAG: transcription initiation factor IIB [Candidatus Bathyarchaeia archaeon]
MSKGQSDRVKECPECGCSDMIKDPDRGELVCKSCGFVVSEEELDRGPDWRAFTLEQRQNLPRAGAPLTLTMHDKGLSTKIGKGRDYSGRRIKSGVKYKYYRLRKWNRRSKLSDSNHRNLSKALSHIGRMGDRLNLPRNVLETASKIYRQALQKDLIQGRTIKGVAATSIYIACRKCNVVRSLEEIAGETTNSVKQLARTYRHIYWKMESDVPTTDHFSCISKIANKLDLFGELERIASMIMEEAMNAMLTVGRNPKSIAAACIYIACYSVGEAVTQREIAGAANVTEVTIRNRYKEILEKLDIDILL